VHRVVIIFVKVDEVVLDSCALDAALSLRGNETVRQINQQGVELNSQAWLAGLGLLLWHHHGILLLLVILGELPLLELRKPCKPRAKKAAAVNTATAAAATSAASTADAATPELTGVYW
jgi:hypothetical protein